MKHHSSGCRYGKDSSYKWKVVDCANCLAKKVKVSVSKTWRDKRDSVIRLVCKHGVSQRFAADVFDLPHSRISQIVKETVDDNDTIISM